jgi:hypothetical protein
VPAKWIGYSGGSNHVTTLRFGRRACTALNKRHDPDLEALILKAATDILQANPHIAGPQIPLSESEHAEIERGREELERGWDEIERQRGVSVTE